MVPDLKLDFSPLTHQENSRGEDGQVPAGPKHRALPQIAQFVDRRNRTPNDIWVAEGTNGQF